MAEFAYNNAKNSSTGYIPFKLNCHYYFCISYKKDINPYSKLKSADKLLTELQKLILIYCENLY